MVFDDKVYSAIVAIADVLNRQLEHRQTPGLHTQEYLVRPDKSAYWRGLYGVSD